MRKRLIRIAIVRSIVFLIWMAITLFLSVQIGEQSGSISRKVARAVLWFLKKFKYQPRSFEEFHRNLREASHFFLHFFFAFFAYRMISIISLNLRGSVRGTIAFCLVMSVAFAVFDEMAQLNIFGRAFEFIDVNLNVYGVTAGTVVGTLITRTPALEYKRQSPRR